ncbi:hypothetical protein [Sanguibacter antarcticus]|uniref:Cell division protein FtsI (Penicillin-binding protein 3) n=1 Tax=Sanguibacter antarcticus TaxID=372484 RepID=A0A2A9E5M2_9MICO|nr:hypothetical protein [Sanguibacter antarcticus]PFG33470.1 cell division protein FtsI (penicillin-binding protein 3) [Sanguibacter antarcticus]
MSTAHASAARNLPHHDRPAPLSRPSEAPPRLRLVQAPAQARSRAPFVLACIGLLTGALLGTLVLNTAMADGAYEAQSLQRELADEAETTDILNERLDALTSPQALAQRATDLGMVRVSEPPVLRLSDQTIIGGAAQPVAGQ